MAEPSVISTLPATWIPYCHPRTYKKTEGIVRSGAVLWRTLTGKEYEECINKAKAVVNT